jgi:hypothetical protein
MRRRKLLLGLGGLAGAGGIVGSGAFTSITANRDVTVTVADDTDALLKLAPSPTANGEYASLSDGTLGINFASDEGGDGPGTDSVYEFDDVFRLTNQGTQTVYVWGTFAGASGDLTASGSGTDIWLYPGDDRDTKLRDNGAGVVRLGVGETVNVGVHVDTHDVTSDQTLTMTIHADAEKPSGSSENQPDTTTLLVDKAGGGDYETVQAALEAATSGDTIQIEPTSGPGYGPRELGVGDAPYRIDEPELTIEGLGSKPSDVEIAGSFIVTIDSAAGNGITVRNLKVDGGDADTGGTGFRISSSGGGPPSGFSFEGVIVENHDGGPGEIAFTDGVKDLTIVDSSLLVAGKESPSSNKNDGLHIDGVAENVDIRRSVFRSNEGSGIEFDGLTQASAVTIEQSNFTFNEKFGIEASVVNDITIPVGTNYFGREEEPIESPTGGISLVDSRNGDGKVTTDTVDVPAGNVADTKFDAGAGQ